MGTELSIQDQGQPAGSTDHNARLTHQEFYQHDPLLALLRDGISLNNAWIATIVFGLALVFAFIFPTLAGITYDQSQLFFDDTIDGLTISFTFLFLFIIYMYLPLSLADLFNTMKENGVIGEPRSDRPGSMTYEEFLKQFVSWSDFILWPIVVLAIGVVSWLLVIVLNNPMLTNHLPVLPQLSLLFGVLPFMYIGFFSIIRVVVALVFINRLFYLFTIHVKPLHSDGSGGLGAIGNILWISAGIMLGTALVFIGRNPRFFSHQTFLFVSITCIIVYLILIAALLVGWLALPHRVMLNARNELLKSLADEYELALSETMPSRHDNTEKIEEGTKRLAALKERYELLMTTFPVWPFAVQEICRLVAAVGLSALISLIPLIVNLVMHK